MQITIRTKPLSEMRYATAGDWTATRNNSNGELIINVTVAETDNDNYNFLIGLHELVEAKLCEENGITGAEVDAWDLPGIRDGDTKSYDELKACENFGLDDIEPGAHPDAPYHQQHMEAECIERIMCGFLEIPWNFYSSAIDRLVK